MRRLLPSLLCSSDRVRRAPSLPNPTDRSSGLPASCGDSFSVGPLRHVEGMGRGSFYPQASQSVLVWVVMTLCSIAQVMTLPETGLKTRAADLRHVFGKIGAT